MIKKYLIAILCAEIAKMLQKVEILVIIQIIPKNIEMSGSVAGPVIQATGRTDFEDGSRTATTLEVSNGLHSVRTSPEVNMAGPN